MKSTTEEKIEELRYGIKDVLKLLNIELKPKELLDLVLDNDFTDEVKIDHLIKLITTDGRFTYAKTFEYGEDRTLLFGLSHLGSRYWNKYSYHVKTQYMFITWLKYIIEDIKRHFTFLNTIALKPGLRLQDYGRFSECTVSFELSKADSDYIQKLIKDKQ